MYLPRNGREYLRITLADTPDDVTVHVSFDGTNWHPTTLVDGVRRVLVCGPDYPPPLDGAVVVADKARPQVRITDTPEVVIRTAVDYIRLV